MQAPQLQQRHFSLVARTVKHLPKMWETWVRSLGQEDPLEKEMANHSSTLAWKIPWTEEPGRLVCGVAESDTTERLHFHFSLSLFTISPPENITTFMMNIHQDA